MDFSTRSPQPQSAGASTHTAPVSPGVARKGKNDGGRFVRLTVTALVAYLLAIVILIAAVLLVLGLNSPKPEDSYVDTTKLQAIFLNTGQVYFGNVKSLNDKYLVLDNIYYLPTSSSGTSTTATSYNTSVSLVKLGCELHAPYDQMVITRSQVTFWENLQPSGQVAKAVATFQKDNPDGQKCSDQSSANTTGTSNVQGTTGTGSTTTSGSSSTTSKP